MGGGKSHKAEENCYILFCNELNIIEPVTANIKKNMVNQKFKSSDTKLREATQRQTFRNEGILYITESI